MSKNGDTPLWFPAYDGSLYKRIDFWTHIRQCYFMGTGAIARLIYFINRAEALGPPCDIPKRRSDWISKLIDLAPSRCYAFCDIEPGAAGYG